VCSLSLCSFHYFPLTSFVLGPNILQHFSLKHPHSVVSLLDERPDFTAKQNNRCLCQLLNSQQTQQNKLIMNVYSVFVSINSCLLMNRVLVVLGCVSFSDCYKIKRNILRLTQFSSKCFKRRMTDLVSGVLIQSPIVWKPLTTIKYRHFKVTNYMEQSSSEANSHWASHEITSLWYLKVWDLRFSWWWRGPCWRWNQHGSSKCWYPTTTLH
jgi:hypothetical protein